ncbi:hypothetical protein K461DRAFT_318814 [Myriangium duriaei CBS 260.36]|uniref:Uncharacterized protein n=1 Tax=Myriangium duriaei CBS 260.36 TaxID=1168546 RepID=A0A9P4J6D9_9PEZI|nr:hypothetical protein K461DRAFT_318814 [Myriangium duriaei CBS 260.36]
MGSIWDNTNVGDAPTSSSSHQRRLLLEERRAYTSNDQPSDSVSTSSTISSCTMSPEAPHEVPHESLNDEPTTQEGSQQTTQLEDSATALHSNMSSEVLDEVPHESLDDDSTVQEGHQSSSPLRLRRAYSSSNQSSSSASSSSTLSPPIVPPVAPRDSLDDEPAIQQGNLSDQYSHQSRGRQAGDSVTTSAPNRSAGGRTQQRTLSPAEEVWVEFEALLARHGARPGTQMRPGGQLSIIRGPVSAGAYIWWFRHVMLHAMDIVAQRRNL